MLVESEFQCGQDEGIRRGRMAAPAHVWACTAEVPKVGFGRISDISLMGRRVRFWLQAVGQRIANYVGITSKTGHVAAPSRDERDNVGMCRIQISLLASA